MTVPHELTGRSLIGGRRAAHRGEPFRAFAPAIGAAIEPDFFSASEEEVDIAVSAAVSATPVLAASTGAERAKLLRSIADGLDAASEVLIERAHEETALPRTRLTGEVARTSGQLRFFGTLVEEGSWVMARIDTADAKRTPPKPDIRSMLRPIGPVVVFGASNFPLAFSVAGGDTASALAGGNPVIVKAHPAHPGTSEIAAHVITRAIQVCGFPVGTFSTLFDSGTRVGTALVKHPAVRAVGFTGSLRGGRALMDLAASRGHPIPVFAEMGSVNPVFILPHALRERGKTLAEGLHASFTLGGGQFCTKPGLVFLNGPAPAFIDTLRSFTQNDSSHPLLTASIANAYTKGLQAREQLQTAKGDPTGPGFSASTSLLEVDYDDFAADPGLQEELFGPITLLVHSAGAEQMLAAARGLDGNLTATILGTEKDLEEHAEMLAVLETKVGRIIFNGFPTGVEVTHAMVHGGPYPATSDGRSTSVGSLAIQRFTRPVCYQNLPQSTLPPELRDGNPLKIARLWNGQWQSA
jgi:2,5-dioxopentanoate dehydrogenase